MLLPPPWMARLPLLLLMALLYRLLPPKPLLLVMCLLAQKYLAKRQLLNRLRLPPLLMQLPPPLRLLLQMPQLPLNRSLLKVLLHRPKVSNSDLRRNVNEEREASASLFLCFQNQT
jgi:hypothetical protein